MNLLELNGIYKSYNRGGIFGRRERFQVLRDIHLDIPSGCCVGLPGRSGSGKSTLGRIALDLEAPDKGRRFFAGRPIHALGKKDYLEYRRNVQVVFQHDIRVLLKICDRLLAMQDGCIMEEVENLERFTPIPQGTISNLVQAVLPATPTANSFLK